MEGNQHIASQFAIQKILDIIELNNSIKILEVGLGIGSISFSVIDFLQNQNKIFNYIGTEANQFCLDQLPINLGGHFNKIKLFSDLEKINKKEKFDLVIIDGSDQAIEKISRIISKNGVIFIEGDRKHQQETLLKLFPRNKFVHLISNYKNSKLGLFSVKNWSGGGKLIYVNPTFTQKKHWLLEKIKSSFRRRIVRRIF